ncbi:MAG: flagellar biosynthetic protein FliO [Oscillospiraceae bacterium]|nr:flagellar biosynthetic protein FliO [Oscillospiraceae bacterium]
MQESLRAIFSIVGILIILVACYYTTYYIGRRAMGHNRAKNKGNARNIAILERYSISKDKSFCIVEVAGKVYIVGVTNQAMTLIDTLDSEKFAEHASVAQSTTPKWNATPGGMLGGKLVNRLAAFMAARMGRPYDSGRDESGNSASFSDSMASARDKSASGQPDRTAAERTDSSEEE